MPIVAVQNILEILKAMAESEQAIARFYGCCAGVWQEDRAFWLDLESEETRHAGIIEQMAEMIRRDPDRFRAQRPFSITAIQTMIAGIDQNICRLNEELLDRRKTLIVARDIEASIIEKAYHEIVKTDDLAYLTLIRRVVSDTVRHKNTIEARIRELAA